jgi:lysophospholipase L1-like esterase
VAVPTTPRRTAPVEENGRRLLPAGYAVVILLVALVVGMLLNAQGLRKTAHIQQQGWQRQVAIALTTPLAAVSHALLIDRPRQGLKSALGRSDDDRIDTRVVFGASAQAASAAPLSRGEFSPAHQLPIWAAGDSLVVVPRESVYRLAVGTGAVRPVARVDGRLATGLERPDVFNWFTYIRDALVRLEPQAVVVSFGANDNHDYMTGIPPGVSIGPFGSSTWIDEYRRRVGGLMDEITQQGRFLVWIGAPIIRDAAESRRFELLNSIYSSEAQKRPGRVAYVDAYTLLQDSHGRYADFLPDASGTLVRVRALDGIHYAGAGGDLIARQVLDRLEQAFDLTSWRRAPAPPPQQQPPSQAQGRS